MNPIIYLDSSAISKRYIIEKGTNTMDIIFDACEIGKVKIIFSIWNIGEVIGVFDKYKNQNIINADNFKESLRKFLIELQKLYELKNLRLTLINSYILIESFPLIIKYQIYQADALQIISSKDSKCDIFISADKKLVNIMKNINKNSFNIETEEKQIQNLINL